MNVRLCIGVSPAAKFVPRHLNTADSAVEVAPSRGEATGERLFSNFLRLLEGIGVPTSLLQVTEKTSANSKRHALLK